MLVGAPGAGKTTWAGTGRGSRGGFSDTDAVIVTRGRKSIPDIFIEDGEAEFRGLETDAVLAALQTRGVVSLGGGAVIDPGTQSSAGRAGVAAREPCIAAAAGRPDRRSTAADGQCAGTSIALLEERTALYAEVARLIVDTDADRSSTLADIVADMDRPPPRHHLVAVMTDHPDPRATSAPYEVVIGTGVLGEFPGRSVAAQRVGIIIPGAAAPARRFGPISSGVHRGRPRGSRWRGSENRPVAAFAWSALAQSGFTRTDALVGVGGGATTDLAGFIAATWLRGVRVIQVPTTLLAMVDAAVGGKTGINVEEGKNLVGVIHEPAGVLCDLPSLETLPRNDLVAGLAEVVKCGFIADPVILDIIESDPQACPPTTPAARDHRKGDHGQGGCGRRRSA